MSDMEKRYTTRELADMLGVEAVTIRKYALALEKYGFSVYRSDGKNRSFSESDVMVFQQLKTLRERSGVNVETAAQLVASKQNTDTQKNVSIVHNDDITLQDQYDQRYEVLEAKIEQLLAMQQAAALALPSPEQLRAERLNEHLAERKVERQLEREALDLWAAKPDSERLQRASLFRKVENTTARDRFIRDYIDEHYEERIRKAYDLWTD